MDDILFSTARDCGDETCPARWHQANYWAYEDGTYGIDKYADGDHDGIDKADLPTPEEVEQSWRDYDAYVAATGTDPLGNFMPPDDLTTREVKYEVVIQRSIVGLVVNALRRNGRRIPIDRLASLDDVRNYLEAVQFRGRWQINGSDGREPSITLEQIAANTGRKIRQGIKITVPLTVRERRADADKRLSNWLREKAAA